MGFFNILETFFFISLAITFILIMMLVYHFKGRITILEQKCDTMFEIMNNIVKEMRMIKMQFHNRVNPEMMLPNNETIIFNENMPNLAQIAKYNQTLEIIEESDDDDEEDYDDEDYEDEEKEKVQKIVVSDNESDDDNQSVKIITIDLENDNDTTGNDDPSVEIDNLEEAIEELPEEEIMEDNDETDNFDVVSEPVMITVNKLDQSIEDDESLVKTETIDYRKLDISYLRTMVITRGLSTDTKKMKKNDLVKLLEQNE